MSMRKNYNQYINENDINKDFLKDILKKLKIDDFIIDQIAIRYYTSTLIKEFIKEVTSLKESDNPLNLVLQFFLLADKMKPITCNKQTLSKLTGLSERTIDERRRARKIPFIQLSGNSDERAGRKIIVFDPIEVTNYLYLEKVRTIN